MASLNMGEMPERPNWYGSRLQYWVGVALVFLPVLIFVAVYFAITSDPESALIICIISFMIVCFCDPSSGRNDVLGIPIRWFERKYVEPETQRLRERWLWCQIVDSADIEVLVCTPLREITMLGGPWDGRTNWVGAGTALTDLKLFDVGSCIAFKIGNPGYQSNGMNGAVSIAQFTQWLVANQAEVNRIEREQQRVDRLRRSWEEAQGDLARSIQRNAS